MKGSSPWTMTPTQPLSPSCLTPAPALQPLDPLVSTICYTCIYNYVLCVFFCLCVCVCEFICGKQNVTITSVDAGASLGASLRELAAV